ncbi:hypothetical protein CEV33_2188 [Brucella grignonensis]|uniref:Uncharacterized protein n=1 Tax=Brucella grignonensis TaxID=94627 RepID=A0A256F7G7_9HYPH|nr:hypothetical protein CEV33_2188 [Brucella grignonensis]
MLTKGLPVGTVPKEFHVAFVWNDMINNGCRLTTTALRECLQE